LLSPLAHHPLQRNADDGHGFIVSIDYSNSGGQTKRLLPTLQD
jgi:hypothetical protein